MVTIFGFRPLFKAADDSGAATPEPFEKTSLDTVLTELNKPEPTPEPAPKPAEAAPGAEAAKPGAEAAKPGEVKPGEAAKPAEAKPAEAAGPFKVGEEAKFKISDTAVKTREEIEKLPYANDATFKSIMGEFEQLAQFKIGMSEALNEVKSLGNYGIKDAETMKAVVADAFMLYDIINLHESPAALLDLASQNFGEDQIKQVVAGILLYAKEKGITAEMYSDLTKPENKKIFELSKESRDRRAKDAETQTANQAKEAEAQKTKDYDSLEKRVNEWTKENKVADEDALDYLTHVVAQIGGDQKQLAALRAGRFAEVERILTEYNNRMVERQKRWEAALTKGKESREEKLKGSGAPAGGGTPPKEAPKKKVDITNDDDRMDAVKAALRE
jgi:hypothetical protein